MHILKPESLNWSGEGAAYEGKIVHILIILLVSNSRFLRSFGFCIIGAIESYIKLAVIYSLTEWTGARYIVSATMAAAVIIIFNGIPNQIWIFGFVAARKVVLAITRGEFTTVSIFGIGINRFVSFLLIESIHIRYISSRIIAITIIALWNFAVSMS